MGWWSDLLGLSQIETVERLADPAELREQVATLAAPVTPPGVMPPPRPSGFLMTTDRALTLVPVYRAVSIIASSVAQLTIDTWRGRTPIDSPSWVRRPDIKMPRSAFLEMTATSLALSGNAFWRVHRASPADAPSALTVLSPHEVYVNEDGTFSHLGKTLQRWQVQHLALLRVPGHLRGLGPIQAAAQPLSGMADVRSYAAEWFNTGSMPNGILSTDQMLSADQAASLKAQWMATVRSGEPAVLGQGLSYAPLLLSPKDAQFIESRQFDTTEVARLFGIPPHMLSAAVEGSSMTYQNSQEADRSFARWTLTQYLREIEQAFSDLLPRGNEARFNMDAFLRADTKARYDAHAVALQAGFLTVDEVRDIEGLDPLTPAPAPRSVTPGGVGTDPPEETA